MVIGCPSRAISIFAKSMVTFPNLQMSPRAARFARRNAAHTGEQFLRAEWLGHVVVGAKLEKQDFVGYIGFCAQHDHRQSRRPCLDFPAYVAARNFRQTEIEDNGRGCSGAESLQRRFSVRRDLDREVFGLEKTFQSPLNSRIIFYDQNFLHNFSFENIRKSMPGIIGVRLTKRRSCDNIRELYT